MKKGSKKSETKTFNKVDLSLLLKAMNNPDYYDLNLFYEPKNDLIKNYFLVSSVNVGKTWRLISEAIVHKVQNNENTIWLRRRAVEINSAFAIQFFTNHHSYLPDAKLTYKHNKDGTTFFINGEPFIFCFSLSTIYSHGNEAPLRVWAVVYDEFMPAVEVGCNFLVGELERYFFMYKSCCRDSEESGYNLTAVTFFLGNDHIKFSPYYTWLGINFKGEDIIGKSYKVITHIPPIVEKNAKKEFFKNTTKSYFNFAVGNKSNFKDNFLVQKIKHYTPIFNLKMGEIYLCLNKAENTFYITRGNNKVTTYGLSVTERGILPNIDLIYNNKIYSAFRTYAMFGKIILESQDLANDYQTLLISGVL